MIRGQNQDTWFDFDEEFLDSGGTAPMSTDYSPTGSPTYAYVSNGVGGQVEATLASSNAAMFLGSGWNDNLQIAGDQPFIVEWRAKINDDLAANEYLLIGACGAIKTGVAIQTLVGLVCAAFYIDEDNQIHILLQGSSSGDDLDVETGIIIDADTFYWFKVEQADGAINWYFGPGMGEDGGRIYSANDGFSNSVKFQPLSGVGKASGTTTPAIANDRVKGNAYRAAV
jgi:hypothetical protein